ncbi:MAG: FtsX-like permease family protein [Alphaproteobacteria bacterium]|nr:FtsX-like permease family protein [Alphaproteobacteria bacterium]
MSKLKLVAENSLRDLAHSDGRISLLTQTLLLAFLLTLTLTSGSIQTYLRTNLDQMLGSDMVIESHTPLTDSQIETLQGMAAGTSRTVLTNITLTSGTNWERAQLKIVDSNYPLQGTLQIGQAPSAQQRPVQRGPSEGEIWLDSRLATKLRLKVGDRLNLGEIDLLVAAILFHEPDRILEGHSVAKRAMVHRASLDAVSLDTAKSRTRFLIAADETAQGAIEDWAKKALPAATLTKKYGGQHPLAGFWTRTENFLGLASVILFFLGAVALDMTNRRWLAKMRYRLAIYASFGTSNRTGMLIALGEWLIGFLACVAIACSLAAIAFGLIIQDLQGYFPGLEVGWDSLAALKTIGLVFVLMLTLQLPSFIQLTRASLLSLIRSTSEGNYVWSRLAMGLISVAILAIAYSDNWLLTGMTLTAITIAITVMIILTWAVIRLGDRWGRGKAGLLPFAFFIMRQRLFAKSAQIMGLGLCGLLLLFTLMSMRDFRAMMEGYGRTHDGNLMISEAQENQIEAIHTWAKTTNSSVRSLRPYVSAQLISVNGKSLADYMQKPSDTLATLKDPIRLSWSDTLPANNRLAGGKWWQPEPENWQQISTEPEVMTDMGLRYGDTLTYDISGEAYEFTLVASHAFKPGGGSITFWFQVPATARPHIDAPTRYMGSMELPERAWVALSQLWQQHPTLSLVPLKELTDRFDQTLGIVTKITSGYAGMILILALFVLAASISGFSADDRQKNGLLMSMGLRKSDCLRLNFYDWGLTAFIAAAGAIIGTWMSGELMYQSQFGLTYDPDVLWLISTLLIMIGLVCFVGFAACRHALNSSVRDLLAE